MIRSVLNSNPALPLTLLLLSVAAGIPSFLLARRKGVSALLAVGTSTATLGLLVATLFPVGPHAAAPMVCTVQRDVIGPVMAAQGLLNIGLFLPAGLLWTLLTRRPPLAFAGLVLLSGCIELVQAVTPGIGRSCDSADWEANLLGAAVGGALGVLAGRGKRIAVRPANLRLGALALLGGGVVLGVAAAASVLVVVVDSADYSVVSADQRAVAARTLKEFFGDGAAVTAVKYVPGPAGGRGVLNVASSAGMLNVSWPSGEAVSGQLGPVEAPTGPARTDEELIAASRRFATAHFPWALSGSTPTAVPAGPDGARDVEWRATLDGVLMPMRFSTVVSADGDVLAFSARHVEPGPLPKATVAEDRARARAASAYPGLEVTGATLLAQSDPEGRWHVRWLLSLKSPPSADRSVLGSVTVDATDGSLVPRDQIVADGGD
ncbi:VanZ family protein [Kitasatospora fiedleri]|uniref:VanZ family protein n=1 Tax=Kitasatospora fiedleri TaxID=2991545 RepID=UPI00249B6DB9|nr:VanZ family protein [Kitasatospora fiedleri]